MFTDNYAEGINQTVFTDYGNYTRIEGSWAYSGFVNFIVTGPGVIGNIYTLNMPSTQDNR